MRVAIIGHGRMGRLLERLLQDVEIYTRANLSSLPATQAEGVIDFSHASITSFVLETILPKGIPLVTGTTGWEGEKETWIAWAKALPDVRWVYGSNFSLGMQVLFHLLPAWVSLIEALGWDWAVWESHHRHKKDSPSGTAKTLAENLLQASRHKIAWALSAGDSTLQITSLRVGDEVGQHSVIFSGPSEEIQVSHRAFRREVFAQGALWALEKLTQLSAPVVCSFSELFSREGLQGISSAPLR
ncbi:MAG: 4-hydroxy-tetrahydrodipicolinate reductase [Bacteroidia bacterium]